MGMDRALEFFRCAAKETDDVPVRVAAHQRGCICQVLRILFAPHTPNSHVSAPPDVPPEGVSAALVGIRTLSRVAGGAVRKEGSFLCVFEAFKGFLTKCALHMW